jgi:hypothetical protein
MTSWGAEQPVIIKIVEMMGGANPWSAWFARPRGVATGTLAGMSSCSSVIADIVEPTDEQELIPTAIAAPRLLAPPIPDCVGDCLTNSVVAHRPLELIDRVVVLFVEFPFHRFCDFGRVNWAPDPAYDVFNDL